MKKNWLIWTLCLLMLIPALSACGEAAPAATPEPTPEPTLEPTPEPVALPNPIHETDADGLVQATGISLPAPEGAENPRWCWIELAGEAPLAEMDFTLDGAAAYLRAQSYGGTEPADISGLYYEWTESGEAEVKYCKAQVFTNGEAGYIAWVDVVPGLLYNLGMKEGACVERLTALANAAFAPLQGDADGDGAAETEEEKYPVYRELLQRIARGLQFGWGDGTVEELGISDIFRRPEGRELGWLQKDINNDGVDELLFGETPEDDGPTPIYDVFSTLAGELVHPATGWECNRWMLLEDGILVNEISSSGFGFDSFIPYGLFNGKLIPANRIVDRSEYLRLPLQPFAEETASSD